MSDPQVVRIPRSDEPHSYVLVHVSQTGQAPLDVSLTATEGENPYAASSNAFHRTVYFELRTNTLE
jgi:hypothetical protein